ILEDVLLKGNISLIGSPLKGLQVLGLMEARGLSFDNVFVLSMTDTVVPSVSEVNPLIPKEISVSLGIGYLGREIDIQKYHFMSLISSAKKVSLIFLKDNNSVKSRFIEEILWNKQYKEKSLSAININDVFVSGSAIKHTKPEYSKNDAIKKYLSEFNYSATNIDTYLECKLKFYYKFVLRLIEQTDYDDEYENIDIGNCLHDFFKETLYEGLTKDKLNDKIFEETFYKNLDSYLEKYFSNNNTGKNYLLKKLIKYKMKEFYEVERERNFTRIVGSELELKSSIFISDKEYKLEARVDRIDENNEGGIDIIDYKSGIVKAPLSSKKYIRSTDGLSRKIIANNINSFQLILYKYLYEKIFSKQVNNCYLYSIKTADMISLFNQKQDKQSVYNEALKQLKYIIAEINSDEPFKAESYDDVNCKRCPYFYLCR
ncbi:MAG: PD-(D/E)XK nuclease family protein, partial [Elusimicrobia bacterium]|nr:PD-(D/E)XK nuclease family protein [Elusimicrobiota bacterium]